MPTIPADFQLTDRSPFSAGEHPLDPREMGAPGDALDRAGTALTDQAFQFEQRYAEARRATAATNLSFGAMAKLDAASDKWGGVPDLAAASQGFLGEAKQIRDDTLQGVDDPEMRQLVTQQITNHAITLDRMAVRGRALGLENAKRVGDLETQLDDTATRAVADNDPFTRASRLGQAHTAIAGAASGGWLPGNRATEMWLGLRDTVSTGVVERGLREQPQQTLADLDAGKYDLSVERRERLQPEIDRAKGLVAARPWLPATAGGAAATQAVNTDIPIEGRALLDTIAGPESRGRYDVRYTPGGGVPFSDFSQHPNIAEPGPQGPSTAAGRYQIVKSTYDLVAPELGISDFSPKSQDALAWQIAQNAYRQRTGSDLLDALKAGKLGEVQAALRDSNQWTTANLGTYQANLAKYTGRSGGSAASVAGAVAPPDAGAAIAHIQGQVSSGDLSQRQADIAIEEITRGYHQWEQVTASARSKLESDLTNGVAMLSAGQQWDTPVQDIRRLLPPDRADQVMKTIDDAQEAGQAKNAIDFASPAEVAQIRERAQAKLSDPADFERNQRYAAQIDQAIVSRNQALADDPAVFVMRAPTVAQANAAIDPDHPDPAATRALIAASLAEQQRLGLPPAAQHALSQRGSQSITALIMNDPEHTPAILRQQQDFYGDAWPKVWQDLTTVGKLPIGFQAVGVLDNQRDAALLARGLSEAAKSGKEWPDLIGAKPVADIRAVVRGDPAVQQLRDSLLKSGSSLKQVDGVVSAIDTLAFSKQLYDGNSSAAQDAIESFTGQYEFMPNGGARVPKTSFDAVSQNAAATLRGLDIAHLQVPAVFGAGAGAPAPEEYLTMLQAAPTWITAPRGNALWLMDPQGRLVRDQAGVPLSVPFDRPAPASSAFTVTHSPGALP